MVLASLQSRAGGTADLCSLPCRSLTSRGNGACVVFPLTLKIAEAVVRLSDRCPSARLPVRKLVVRASPSVSRTWWLVVALLSAVSLAAAFLLPVVAAQASSGPAPLQAAAG